MMQREVLLWPSNLPDYNTVVVITAKNGDIARYNVVGWDGQQLKAIMLGDVEPAVRVPSILSRPRRDGD